MRIILDGMGGDNAPGEIVKGAAIASKLVNHEICILGDEEQIKRALSENDHEPKNITVVHTSEIVTNEDKPVKAIRHKKDSSLVKGLMLVKRGEGDMFLSAGNSGALMTGALLLLGRIGRIERPALGAPYPFVCKKTVGMLIDAGANPEVRPGCLLYFGMMGSIYADKVFGYRNPKVGLANMGTEPGKGSSTLQEAYDLLELAKEQKGLNFIGNIEGRDIPMGIAEVIVCDGMTGNMILKMTEGMGISVLTLMKEYFMSSPKAKIGAMLLKSKLTEMKAAFNYNEYGGAPILGVKAPVLKIHGSSSYEAVVYGITKGVPYVEENVIGEIERAAAELDELLESRAVEE